MFKHLSISTIAQSYFSVGVDNRPTSRNLCSILFSRKNNGSKNQY